MSTITLRSTKGTPLTNSEVDSNFSNLNSDKYESGSSPVFTDVQVNGSQKNSVASLTAAGSNQGTATAITKTLNNVSGADGTTGVVLPVSAAGLQVAINNVSAFPLKIYPSSGQTINSLSANTAYSLAPYTTVQLYCKDNFGWLTQTGLVIYDQAGTRLN